MNEMLLFLTKGLSVHLNFGQSFMVNSASGFLSLETITTESLFNKQTQLVGDAHIRFPSRFDSSFTQSTRNLLRVRSFFELISVYAISSVLDNARTIGAIRQFQICVEHKSLPNDFLNIDGPARKCTSYRNKQRRSI